MPIEEDSITDRLRACEECLAAMAATAPPKTGQVLPYGIRQFLEERMRFVSVMEKHQSGRLTFVSDAAVGAVGAFIGAVVSAFAVSWFKK